MTTFVARKLTEQVRIEACAEIDRQAEDERMLYITPGTAMAMVYQEKTAEAEAYLSNPDIDPAAVPHLQAEVGITGETLYHVAQVVLGLRDYWKFVSADIEGRRLAAKAAIMSATTMEELGSISWTG